MEDNIKNDNIYQSTFLNIIAEEYLNVLTLNEEYKCYYINDKLEIQEGYGYIASDGLYNYHKNEDISKNMLYVKDYPLIGENKPKWWSLSLEKAKQKQKPLIALKISILKNKIEKVEKAKGVIIKLEK